MNYEKIGRTLLSESFSLEDRENRSTRRTNYKLNKEDEKFKELNNDIFLGSNSSISNFSEDKKSVKFEDLAFKTIDIHKGKNIEETDFYIFAKNDDGCPDFDIITDSYSPDFLKDSSEVVSGLSLNDYSKFSPHEKRDEDFQTWQKREESRVDYGTISIDIFQK